MDRAVPKSNAALAAGLSIHNGPVDDGMDVDAPSANGANKRKSRSSISKINYRDESDSDAEPLVRLPASAAKPSVAC